MFCPDICPQPSHVLYCTVLYCTVLYCTVLYCTVLYCTVLYCTVLYWLYCTDSALLHYKCKPTKQPPQAARLWSEGTRAAGCAALYGLCTALYCTVLYCTVLYCTVNCTALIGFQCTALTGVHCTDWYSVMFTLYSICVLNILVWPKTKELSYMITWCLSEEWVTKSKYHHGLCGHCHDFVCLGESWDRNGGSAARFWTECRCRSRMNNLILRSTWNILVCHLKLVYACSIEYWEREK